MCRHVSVGAGKDDMCRNETLYLQAQCHRATPQYCVNLAFGDLSGTLVAVLIVSLCQTDHRDASLSTIFTGPHMAMIQQATTVERAQRTAT